MDISVVNSWIIFHSNNPESDVKTHPKINFIWNWWTSWFNCYYICRHAPIAYMIPKVDLLKEVMCVSVLGKPIKSMKCGRFSVCYSNISPTTNKKKDKKHKIIIKNAMFTCVRVRVFRHTTLVVHFCSFCLHVLFLLEITVY